MKFIQRAVEKYRFSKQQRAVDMTLNKFDKPYKLHLGCGKVRLDGWINIDADAELATIDICWDLTYGIPFAESTCSLIFCEHMLEHMTADEGVKFLRDCRRVLEPGGVIRIAMPSLDNLLEKSYMGTWREQDWLKTPDFSHIKTRAEMINVSFYSWGHKWLYDREELHRRLNEAGFLIFKDVEKGNSDVQELRNLETREDSILICEAQK